MNAPLANGLYRALQKIAAPKPVRFAALSPADRYALILHVQCDVRPSHDPLTEREAERHIEELTEQSYARLIAAFRGD